MNSFIKFTSNVLRYDVTTGDYSGLFIGVKCNDKVKYDMIILTKELDLF